MFRRDLTSSKSNLLLLVYNDAKKMLKTLKK